MIATAILLMVAQAGAPREIRTVPQYAKDFFAANSDHKDDLFQKLTLEQQIEVGSVGLFREPSSNHWFEAAIDRGGDKAVRFLLGRLARFADSR
jgi:hypothetical protein